ncbi:tRNA-dihydrouridine synthase family protein [bacterium]|nr:tRNA-dihydrouridine synthase family protein [bacterium]
MKSILYMAPIRGVTNCTYRNIYSRMFKGYDIAVTPFINSAVIENCEDRAMRDLFIHRNDVSFDLIPQILGNDSVGFIAMAKVMGEMGYTTVNWNLACPHKRVANKKRGSGMLADPDNILRLLDEIIPAIPIEISLKVRLGKDDPHQLSKLIPRLDDYPLEEIIIHPRTGLQMYKGEADPEAFQEVLNLTRHQVVYNGDIDSLQKFESLQERFPSVHRWMIGRGGLTDPFLPEQIKQLHDPAAGSRIERYFQFHEALFSEYQVRLEGDAHLLAKMKEIWIYWSAAFEGGRRLYGKISKIKSLSTYRALVDTFFSKDPQFLI